MIHKNKLLEKEYQNNSYQNTNRSDNLIVLILYFLQIVATLDYFIESGHFCRQIYDSGPSSSSTSYHCAKCMRMVKEDR